MDHSDCLVHRVGSYPLVAGLTEQALQAYNASKDYSPLLNTTLTYSEAWAAVALKAMYPLYVKLEGPMEKAQALALSQLPAIEAAVPALNMTPGELAAAGHARFLKGGIIERSLAAAKGAPALAAGQAAAATELAALVATQGKDTANRLLRTTAIAFNSALDAADKAVAKVKPVEGLHQIGDMATAAGTKIRARASSGLQASRELLAWEQERAMALLQYLRGLGGRYGYSNLAALRTSAVAAFADLEAKAQTLKENPEALLLSWIKNTSGLAASMADKSLKLLPKAQAGLQTIHDYLANIDTNIKEAESLGDVGSEVWKEAKVGKEVVEERLVHALEALSDTPPLSWMTAPSTPMEATPSPGHISDPDTPKSSCPSSPRHY